MARLRFLVAAATLTGTRASAQDRPARPSCEGRRITSISVTPERPPFVGTAGKWRAAARAMGLHHATTRPEVIRGYSLLKIGEVCSDTAVVETERVLRALPFIADAHADTRDDGSGGVAVDIRTTDEIPVLVSGSLRHGEPWALALGNENIAGLGIRAIAGGERAGAYRSAGHFEIADYAPFNRAATLRLQGARDPLGSHLDFDATHLFRSNSQRRAWFVTYRLGDDYPIVRRPNGDATTVEVHSDRWAIGGVFRRIIGPVVTLAGPVAMGGRVRPMNGAIAVTDSGAFPINDTALVSSFESLRTARLGGLFGVRRVGYVSRVGLDGLFATQDVMVGWQAGVVVAPGVSDDGGQDMLVGNSIYLGGVYGHVVAIADAEAEGRRDFGGNGWTSTVGNARASAYFAPSPRLMFDLQDNYSALGEARVPTQLSLGDPMGGPRGYVGSNLSGGRRNVTRLEVRGASPRAMYGADVGLALFTDAGVIWPGDVPFGVAATRQSVGLSVLAAYPTRSKRLYRIDFAFALQGGGRGFEVRFSNGDPTVALAAEPSDVTQARLAPIPASLFAWPGR
jgi:hypothetical protein